jgi:hypothetical protein
MKAQTLLKKNAIRAAASPGHLITGASSVLLSIATLNPLPAIVWGVGSATWILHSVSSGRYSSRLLEEEREQLEADAERHREAIRQKVQEILAQPPFVFWVQSRQLPNYMHRYQTLFDIRESVSGMVDKRDDFTKDMERDVVAQVNTMLEVYLRLVQSRTVYLHLLNETFPIPVEVPVIPPQGFLGKLKQLFVEPAVAPPLVAWRYPDDIQTKMRMLSFNERIQKLQSQIDALKAEMRAQPAAAKQRESHITLLEEHMKLLRRWEESDQRIVAQLEMIPDFFKIIQSRLGASEFTAGEFTNYMGEVVGQVDASMKLADEIRQEVELISGPQLGAMMQDLTA